jgi:multimeric flavodoxin WrbA
MHWLLNQNLQTNRNMKVITILGSPKKKGKTAQALDLLEGNLIAKGHEVERIHVTDYQINGCIGCFSCFRTKEEPGCVQKDDAMLVFERMMQSDVIVYASPIYSFDFTAQIKPLIDRHLCLAIDFGQPSQTSLIADKRVALLLTCGGPAHINADLTQESFSRAMKLLQSSVIGNYVISSSSNPDFIDWAEEITVKLAGEISK